MKRTLLSAALALCALASSHAQLVTVETWQALRVNHQRVKLTLEESGRLTRESDSGGKKDKTIDFQVPAATLESLKKRLLALNWKTVAKDKNVGLDGSSVRIRYDGQDIKLWAPDYDASSRGLADLVAILTDLNRCAGLDAKGLPDKNGDLITPPKP